MKNLCTLLFTLFFLGGSFAQSEFTVPERTFEQKHQRMLGQFTFALVGGISFAKSQGKTAKEYGTYMGQFAAKSWNKDAGFKELINGVLRNSEEFRLSGEPKPEILSQSDNMVTLKMKLGMDRYFGDQGLLGVSFEEFLTCFNAINAEVANFMETTFEAEYKDGWYMATFKKK